MPLWKTTSYTLDCPKFLWQEYKEAKDGTQNLNDALVEDIAGRVLDERADELDDDQRERIEEMIPDGQP